MIQSLTNIKNGEQEKITNHAVISGLQVAAGSGSIIGAGVFLAQKYSPWFRKSFSTTSKTALIVMGAAAAFSIRAESLLIAGARNPKAYIGNINIHNDNLENNQTDLIKQQKKLRPYHHIANFVYDYPFRTIALLGTPLLGLIYYEQNQNKNITKSLKILHTRIYGQGSIVLLLLGSMAFHDYMSKRGRYTEESLE